MNLNQRKVYGFYFLLSLSILGTTLTSSKLYFDEVKWFVVYSCCFLLSFFSLFFSYKKNDVEIIDSLFFYISVVLIIAGYFVAAFINPFAYYQIHFLDWLCFFVITSVTTYLFNNNFYQTWNIINNVTIFSTLIFVTITIKEIYLHGFYFQGPAFQYFFGNKNLFAEFLGFSLIIQFISLLINEYKKGTFLLRLFTLCLTSQLMVMTLCRSVWLGVLISLLFFIWAYRNKISSNKLKVFLGVLLVIFSSFFVFKYFNEKLYPKTKVDKMTSANVRLARWENTLQMAKENVFGVGLGHYEFGYSKYHSKRKEDTESTSEYIIRSPHNVFLELLVEGGIISFIGLILLLTFIFKDSLKNDEKKISSVFFLFLIINGFFSFPLETGVTFLLISIITGLYISTLKRKKINLSNLYIKKKLFQIFLTGIIGLLAYRSMTAIYYEYNYGGSLDHMRIACSFYPEHWRSCVQKANLEMDAGLFDEAIKTLEGSLKLDPANFVVLKSLADAYWEKGNFEKSCELTYQYDSLFLMKSEMHELFVNECL